MGLLEKITLYNKCNMKVEQKEEQMCVVHFHLAFS
jgi:hypothetical protein